ncbi:MAG: glycosyltransferase [Clostridia bacterium]|nr:glycosyltransferase [Clostridia bacterium]
MSKKKQLMFIMPVMKGGGAEKVAALLLNEFNKNGYECELVLTNSDRDEIVDRGLDSDIKLTVLRESFAKNGVLKKIFIAAFRLFTSLICKIPEAFSKKVPSALAQLSFKAQYFDELNALKKHFESKPDASILSFLQPSIPLTLLAAKTLPNKVVVSERADPHRLLKKRYGYNFIKKYYQRADAVVFQTNDAKAAYPDNISAKGTVIFNPINDKLPEPYFGEREKYITTFCRVSRQKNLPVLVEAFAEFRKEFNDYRLKIIGEPQNDDDIASLNETKALADKLGIAGYVDFMPFNAQVHSSVIRDAMYVNSSDYEGMSNAMLEAMAIGMPVVCTDCPIGGANAVINNNENGILTQTGNTQEISGAMKRIAGDKEFADKLSKNAAEIRFALSLENTAKKWMELL